MSPPTLELTLYEINVPVSFICLKPGLNSRALAAIMPQTSPFWMLWKSYCHIWVRFRLPTDFKNCNGLIPLKLTDGWSTADEPCLKFFLSFSHLWNLICAHQNSFLTLADTHTLSLTHTYAPSHTHTHFSKITQTHKHTVLGLRKIRPNCQ